MKCRRKINPTAIMKLVKTVKVVTKLMLTYKRQNMALLSKIERGRVAQYGYSSRFLRGGCCVIIGLGWIEHQPPKLGVVGSNPTAPAISFILMDKTRSDCC
jgi:hypothetical protein